MAAPLGRADGLVVMVVVVLRVVIEGQEGGLVVIVVAGGIVAAASRVFGGLEAGWPADNAAFHWTGGR